MKLFDRVLVAMEEEVVAIACDMYVIVFFVFGVNFCFVVIGGICDSWIYEIGREAGLSTILGSIYDHGFDLSFNKMRQDRVARLTASLENLSVPPKAQKS